MVIVPLLRGRNGEMTPTRNAEINLFHLHHLVPLLQPCGTLPPSIVFVTCSFTSLCCSTLLLLLLVLLSLLLTPYPVTERPYRTYRWDPSGWGGKNRWPSCRNLIMPEHNYTFWQSLRARLLLAAVSLLHSLPHLVFCVTGEESWISVLGSQKKLAWISERVLMKV